MGIVQIWLSVPVPGPGGLSSIGIWLPATGSCGISCTTSLRTPSKSIAACNGGQADRHLRPPSACTNVQKSPIFVTVAVHAATRSSPASNPKPPGARNPTCVQTARPQVTRDPLATPKDAIRLVIQFSGHPPKMLKETPTSDLHNRLTVSFAGIPCLAQVPVLGVHRNRPGNLILSLPMALPRGHFRLPLPPSVRLLAYLMKL